MNIEDQIILASPREVTSELVPPNYIVQHKAAEVGGNVVCNLLRLADHLSKVSTFDLAEATPTIQNLQGYFQAENKTHKSTSPIRVSAAQFGQIGVSTFSFGRTTEITPFGLANSVLVTTVINGKAGIITNGTLSGATTGATFFTQEEDKPKFLYEPDTEVLKLRIDRHRIETFYNKLTGQEVRQPIRFKPIADTTFPADRWIALLRLLVMMVNSSEQKVSTQEISCTEEMLMLALLYGQQHNQLDSFNQIPKAATPRHFRLAIEYINQYLAEDISLTQISEAVGCSVRSLARTFNQLKNTSPMQYVQRMRLEKIRKDLLDASLSQQTISEIAYAWGCRHLGEFNRQYRAIYGETPSETRGRSC